MYILLYMTYTLQVILCIKEKSRIHGEVDPSGSIILCRIHLKYRGTLRDGSVYDVI